MLGIFTSSPLAQTVFIFVLLFALVFGVLQKSKILGENSKQVNALVALAIGLLVVSVTSALDLISKMVPILAVGLVLILIFLLLVGFFYKEGTFEVHSSIKYTVMALAFIAIVVFTLYYTGSFPYISNFFSGSGDWIGNVLVAIVVIAAFLIAFFSGSKGSDKKGG